MKGDCQPYKRKSRYPAQSFLIYCQFESNKESLLRENKAAARNRRVGRKPRLTATLKNKLIAEMETLISKKERNTCESPKPPINNRVET